ncbi:MAG: TonB-dependent receptor [Deltaproteobacteria bacterium]|nr:TonB-dependent receptor [Deltaproteobacteria bacterium]
MARARVIGLSSIALVAATTGAALAEPVSGHLLDGISLQPIVGATVTGPGGATATTDKAGGFAFPDLPAGEQPLAAAAAGYEASTENVTIPEGGTTDVTLVLYKPGATGELVEIKEDAPIPPPPGKQDLRREEIAKIPGTRGDALQSIRSLPGVAQAGPPGIIVIRGAAPQDSRITIDGVDVPILYHFFGLQSVLPTEFIDNIEFLPGGFGADQGRAIGGVINVTTRSDAVKDAEGFAEVSFINVAGLVQAPLSKKHKVQMSAAIRRSLIDFILPAVLPSSVKFTTAPTYYDAQLRVDWRPNDRDRLSLFALGSYDQLALITDTVNANDPSLSGAKFENVTEFTRLIATWQHAHNGFDNRLVGSIGTGGFRIDIGTNYLDIHDKLAEFRDDVGYKVSDQLKLRAGAEARYDLNNVNVKFPGQPAEGEPPPSNFTTLPLITYMKKVDASVSGVYVAADLRPTKRTLFSPGVRLDHYYHIDASTISPRIQVSQGIGKDWTVRAALGSYSQPLTQGQSVPTNLDPELATQYVVGAEYAVRDGITASGSAFYNDRERLVVRDPTAKEVDPLNAYVNRGYGRSFGAEFLVRGRLDNFFGWLSYTVSRSDRIAAPDGPRYLFDFDQTHNVIAVGSYTLGKWQFGGRWQYASGSPTTPVLGSTYVSDANVFIPIYGGLNTARIEAAHQLDVRVDRTWKFNAWSLAAYLDITNVYAHAQVLGYNYNYDYSQRTATKSLPILPAIGVRGSF